MGARAVRPRHLVLTHSARILPGRMDCPPALSRIGSTRRAEPSPGEDGVEKSEALLASKRRKSHLGHVRFRDPGRPILWSIGRQEENPAAGQVLHEIRHELERRPAEQVQICHFDHEGCCLLISRAMRRRVSNKRFLSSSGLEPAIPV